MSIVHAGGKAVCDMRPEVCLTSLSVSGMPVTSASVACAGLHFRQSGFGTLNGDHLGPGGLCLEGRRVSAPPEASGVCKRRVSASAVCLQAPCVCKHRVSASTVCLQALCVCKHCVSASTVCLQALYVCKHCVSASAVCLQAPCVCKRCVSASAVCLQALCVCKHCVSASAVCLASMAHTGGYLGVGGRACCALLDAKHIGPLCVELTAHPDL